MDRRLLRAGLVAVTLAGALGYGVLGQRNGWPPWHGLARPAAEPKAPASPAGPGKAMSPTAAAPAPEAPGPRRRAPWVPEGAPPGSWRRAATLPTAAAGEEDLSKLAALPYLQGYRKAQELPAVSRYDPARADKGLNLYVSGHAAEAILTDMEGRPLHRWRLRLRRLWPDLARDPEMAKLEYWRRAHVYPDGGLLAIYEGLGMVRLDARSQVLWSRRGGFHHDFEVLPDGRIYSLDREGKVIPEINPAAGVLEDFVTVLGPGGRVRRRISILKSFQHSRYAGLLRDMPRAGDILHTNTVEVLDGRFAAEDPAFRAGNLLVSSLTLDALAVIDPGARPGEERVVWALKGEWRRQHQPTFVTGGHLLLFDNLGAGRKSRVLEIDPRTRQVVWSYGGKSAADLFSRGLGSCQRLPNGNTLITESENGRALEVTRDGDVVWELYNPHRAGKDGELVATLFEVVRLPPDFPFRGRAGDGGAGEAGP